VARKVHVLNSDEVAVGFRRQRRNLLAISLVLLAFESTGAVIDTLTVFGNTIHLGRPLSLELPLWLGWAYWLVRYYQYFRDIGDKGFALNFNGRLQLYGGRIAVSRFLETFRFPDLDQFVRPSKPITDFKRTDVVGYPIGAWEFDLHGSVTVLDRGSSKASTQMVQGVRVFVPLRALFVARVRAFLWVCIHTRLMTEYGLPFAIAFLPVLMGAVRLIGRLAT
jgi:hypothetical protein